MVKEAEIDLAVEAVPLTDGMTDLFDPLRTGFMWYLPPLASSEDHTTGGHRWNIVGHDMQILTMTVPAGQQVVTEAGSFMYMSPFMETSVELTLCSREGFSEGCNRILGGENCVKVFLKNETGREGYVGLTPNFPAKVIPVSCETHATAQQIGRDEPRGIFCETPTNSCSACFSFRSNSELTFSRGRS